MDKPPSTTTPQEPVLLSDEAARNAIFPGPNKPSLRAWRDWRSKGYYSYVKVGKRVFINAEKARKELEARFTIEAI